VPGLESETEAPPAVNSPVACEHPRPAEFSMLNTFPVGANGDELVAVNWFEELWQRSSDS
jgi:hypothetical protein